MGVAAPLQRLRMIAHMQQNELKHTRQKLVSLGVAAPLQRLRMTAHTQQNEQKHTRQKIL